MTRARGLVATLPLALLAACGGNGGSPIEPKACDASLASMAIPNSTVVSAKSVPAGSFVPAFRTNPVSVPALCQVVGYASPTPDSRINFELWVPPASAWNGKFLVTGNGGYSPSLSYGDMVNGVNGGYAVIGGDTGHTGESLQFVVGHPEKMTDWGTRSVGEIAKAGKPLIEALEARPISRTYYMGCSTGGHQGYAAVQHYPGEFDGVIAGAPGNNRTRLNAAFLYRYLANRQQGDNSANVILPASKLPAITNAIVGACDALDGVVDGVLEDPRRCTFNTSSLLCTAGDASNCLTPAQKTVLDKFYADIRNPRTGELLYPAFPLGAEVGYQAYWGTTEPTRADYWRYWVFETPNWDPWTFDFDTHIALADQKIGPRVDQVNPDIGRFKARGGKLLVYNGWADQVVNAIDTIRYYDQVKAMQGSQAEMDSFFRMFLVPGLGHCTDQKTGFGSFNMLAALDAWVDRGIAPDRIVASRVVSGSTTRTHPLCPYPKVARYNGSGSIDSADSFTCANP